MEMSALKFIHPIQLKAADFKNINIFVVSAQPARQSFSRYFQPNQHSILLFSECGPNKQSCGRFSVAACYANHFGICETGRKFYFGDHWNICFSDCFHKRNLIRNSRTFYDFRPACRIRFRLCFLSSKSISKCVRTLL